MFTGVVCLIGAIFGGVAGWLIVDRKSRWALGGLRTESAVAAQRCTDLSTQLDAEKVQTQSLRDALAAAQRDLAAATAQFHAAQQNLLEQRQMLSDAQVHLREVFARMSAEALAQNNQAFLQLAGTRFDQLSVAASASLDQRKEQIDGLLKPMREVMDQYQRRIEDIEKLRLQSFGQLQGQLGSLNEAQRSLNVQTAQLAQALSQPTGRGQWGEISLRRIIELAGLTEHYVFNEQQTLDAEGNALRPDMIVTLPEGRAVIIDCKTSLSAFQEAAAAADDKLRQECLQRHAQHVRSHAQELGEKGYWRHLEQSADFVIMFLPGESFFYEAVRCDAKLIDYAFERRVIIATPTTLIALLRTIDLGWRQQKMAENAGKVIELGQVLYERIGTVLSHVEGLGSSLESSVKSYNSMIKSLESRLIVTARKMRELGVGGEEIQLPRSLEIQPQDVPQIILEPKIR